MLLNTPLPFVKTFVDELDNGLRAHEPGKGLSSTQRKWLGFCLMGILLTNSICWARFERASLGKYKQSAEPVDVSSFPNSVDHKERER